MAKLGALLTEPDGWVESLVQDDHHVPLVPALLRYPLPQQKRSAGGENNVLASCRLLSRIRWWVLRPTTVKV